MARIDIRLNGRDYPIACADGQEGRVREIAAYLDGKLNEVRATVRNVADNHMLVMTAILVADELIDLRNQSRGQRREPDPAMLAAARAEGATAERDRILSKLEEAEAEREEEEAELADRVARLADRLQALAGRFEAA